MAVYKRITTAADITRASNLWNQANVQTMLTNQGYPGVGPEDWSFSINNPRRDIRVYGAFNDAQTTLHGFAEFILHRQRPEGFLGRWCINPTLSLANIRTHRDGMLKALWQALPDNWVVFWVRVPVNAVRIREYFAARPSVPFVDFPADTDWPITRHYGPVTAQMLEAAA